MMTWSLTFGSKNTTGSLLRMELNNKPYMDGMATTQWVSQEYSFV